MFQPEKKEETRNVTIRVPVHLLEELRTYAQKFELSLNALMVQIFTQVIGDLNNRKDSEQDKC